MSARKPSLVQVLELAQLDLQKRIRTVVPATVVSYDPVRLSAFVQPAPMETFRGSSVPEIPSQVPDAPVAFPAGGGFAITWALLPGDPVLLLCSDRDIDGWRASGSPYAPSTARKHNLSDGFVWPGTGPAPDPVTGASGTDLVIHTAAGATITVTPAGTIALGVGASAPSGQLALAQALHTYLVDAVTAATPAASPDGGAALKTSLLGFLEATPFTAFATVNTVAS